MSTNLRCDDFNAGKNLHNKIVIIFSGIINYSLNVKHESVTQSNLIHNFRLFVAYKKLRTYVTVLV